MRFSKLDIQVEGSLTPGSTAYLSVETQGNLPPEQTHVRLTLPELAALKARKEGKLAKLAPGKPLPAQGSWRGAMGSSQTLQQQTTVHIKEPGYYQVIASASAENGDVRTKNGEWIKNTASQSVWLWVTEAGGKVTKQFDRSLFPDGARQQPGPLTMKDERPKLPVVNARPSSQKTRLNSTGVTTIYMNYINQTTHSPEPLSGARVSYTVYDGLGRKRSSSTEVIDDNGNVAIPCYSDDIHGPGSYSGTIHVQDNYRLRVYHPQTGSDVVGSFSGEFATDCGQQIPVRAAYKMSHVFMRMSETIEKSRSFFQEQRGKIHVKLNWNADNSYYCDGFNAWGPCTGTKEKIVIKDRPGDDPNSHIGGQFGDLVVAHEYGHAMHEEALNGNAASGECPSPHYLDGAHNLQCAYSEGFANYHGAVGVNNSNSYVGYFENNLFYSADHGGGDPNDGSIIEGAVAAFLWDLTDPADESHDNAYYPGSYVADIIKTCKTDGSRANGADQLIACFQSQVPSYAGYFNTRSSQPSSFSESATEPSSWSRTDVKTLWRKNLYGETYNGPPLTVSVSGPQILDEGEMGTWTASPSNGSGSYNYDWEIQKTLGGSWINVCGSSSSCSWNSGQISQSLDARIQVTVQSGSESASANKSFLVNNNGGDPGCDGISPSRICP
jgi:hypothetical protein